MGSDATAKLFFGICLDEDLELPWEDCEDEEYYADKMGVTAPTEEFSDETKDKYHLYWDEKTKICKSSKCRIINHCHGDGQMFAVAVNESVKIADWGDTECIENIVIDELWETDLKNYCDTMGIEYTQPKWWLVAYWG